jgi:hypothetical protein
MMWSECLYACAPFRHCRFDVNQDGVLDLDEFTALVWAMDKTVDESDVLTMFQQALDLTAQGDRIAKVRERIEGGSREENGGQLVYWITMITCKDGLQRAEEVWDKLQTQFLFQSNRFEFN